MGTCAGHTPNRKSTQSDKNARFKPTQIQLIQVMYNNLAKRCRNNLVTRETFDLFFHSSGLVGQILFLKFDAKKAGTISFQDFLEAFGIMIKGTLKQRADILFDMYDVNGAKGIDFDGLLKILFSYSLDELNKMFAEENFLKYLETNNLNLNHYFGPEKKIQERNVIDEESQTQQEQATKNKKYAVPSSVVLSRVHTDVGNNQNDAKDAKVNFNGNKWENITKTKPKKQNQITSTVFGDNAFNGKVKRKNFKIRSNIASLTRLYARYLFVSANLNKDKDNFKKEHFFKLIQDHPSLFQAYLSGFHAYVWQVDDLGDPEYLKAEPWVQSEAEERYQEEKSTIYLKFIHKTIFVMAKRKKIPKDIINLEGLTFDTIQTDGPEKQYALVFKHRDGLYPPKGYYFKSKDLFSEWTRHLIEFKTTAIEDLYIRQQKIGGGNFSNVFRGKEKKTGKEVAIKVIQTYKLTPGERQVLKRQTGILKQCHHPNIVKFQGQFKTKTHLYIVTQILTEGDLYEYTKRNCFLEEYQAAIVLKQLIDAILYINEELGVIHRDLKPENVLVKMNEEKKIVHRVKIIDFGFGVFKDKLQDLSPKEKFAGTPGFIAPEIYSAQDYDYKIDTFSLGIILYFMLSGNFPFHSQFLEEIEELTKSCSISMVNNHWSNISDEAKDLIKKVLCFKEKRITTREMADHPWLKNIEKLKQYNGRNLKVHKNFLE